MNIKPLFDRVLAKPLKQTKNQTKSGISLEMIKEDETKRATVISVGSGNYENGFFIKTSLKPNDIIFYEEHSCAKILIDNTEYILIKESDVLAVEKIES